jgi:hypothetical protein
VVEALLLPRALPALLDALRLVERLHQASVTSVRRAATSRSGFERPQRPPDEVTQRLCAQYCRRFGDSANRENAAEMVEATAPQHGARNWYAIACLWLVVASWLALALRILLGEMFSIDSTLDWLYVGALLAAPVAGVAGLIAVHRRGEAWLAVTAFVVSLFLPGMYALAYILVDVFFGDLGGADFD